MKQFYLTNWWDPNRVQSGPGNNVSEGALHIPQRSWNGASPKDVFYFHAKDTCWEASYPSAQIQSEYSTVLANRVVRDVY